MEGEDKVLGENKISSSARRRALLGTIRRPLRINAGSFPRPFVIGLTGGIASGKSNAAKVLARNKCQVSIYRSRIKITCLSESKIYLQC